MVYAPKDFADLLAHARDVALFVDFDGTLVDLVPDPDAVQVPQDLIENLERLTRDNEVAIAFSSGRTIVRLDQFCRQAQLPAVGNHGAEIRWQRYGEVIVLVAPLPEFVVEETQRFAQSHGAIFELKEYSVSVHLPLEQQEQDVRAELADALHDYAVRFDVKRAGRTYEVMWRGVNKGSGIRQMMELPLFEGKCPIYIGDDALTDVSLDCILVNGGVLISTEYGPAFDPAKSAIPPVTTAEVRALIAAAANG